MSHSLTNTISTTAAAAALYHCSLLYCPPQAAPTIVMTQRGARKHFQAALRSKGVEVIEFDFLTPEAVADYCYQRGFLQVCEMGCGPGANWRQAGWEGSGKEAGGVQRVRATWVTVGWVSWLAPATELL